MYSFSICRFKKIGLTLSCNLDGCASKLGMSQFSELFMILLSIIYHRIFEALSFSATPSSISVIFVSGHFLISTALNILRSVLQVVGTTGHACACGRNCYAWRSFPNFHFLGIVRLSHLKLTIMCASLFTLIE